ncbi:MAG TPA: glycosyltransferase family 4 protein [Anaerolineales bacterium]|nr:glycosyltransferase family 4 protein [Anaerolineales bacterium]
MRILFVADGRSPIALNWIRYFVERGDDVFLASTFACSPDMALRELQITPVAFSGTRPQSIASQGGSALGLRWRTALRHALGPLTIPSAARGLRSYIQRVQPDLVHAMRIPFEGMLASDARAMMPLVVSVWGNDFTLHAASTPLMRHYTEWTVAVADALHADCHRDIRLAREWGLDISKPTLVIPGSGGVRLDVFHAPQTVPEEPVVINPRGARAYVRTDVFLLAIPRVLQQFPKARFLCTGLAGDRDTAQLISKLDIAHAVQVIPQVTQQYLAELFRGAQVLVSPSTHDGTPNTLLEGMACGCLPVAGNLDSIREWIRDGENGLLVDATDVEQVADAILRGLQDKDLRQRAAGLNQALIRQRAEYGRCMQQAADFYARVIASPGASSIA